MRRVAPSVIAGEQLQDLLAGGADRETNIVSAYAVREAPTLDAARAAADRLINTYRREFPAAVACFEDDLDALLAIHASRSATACGCAPRTSPNAHSSRNAGAPRSSAGSPTNAPR